LDAPHGCAYLPFFGAAAEGAPESFKEGRMSSFSKKAAWWAFNLVNQYSEVNFQLINKDVRAKSHEVEIEGQHLVESCLAKARKLSRGDAARELSHCSNEFAEEKVAEWWDFAWSLFAKFGRYAVTYNESDVGEGYVYYPAWWLNSPEVGFSLWSPNGPYHGVLESVASGSFGWADVARAMIMAGLCAAVAAAGFQAGHRRGQQGSKEQGDLAPYVPLAAGW